MMASSKRCKYKGPVEFVVIPVMAVVFINWTISSQSLRCDIGPNRYQPIEKSVDQCRNILFAKAETFPQKHPLKRKEERYQTFKSQNTEWRWLVTS